MTTKSPEETRAISRLRALGQGIKVFCLDQDKLYCVPSASGDGSAYQVHHYRKIDELGKNDPETHQTITTLLKQLQN